MRKILYILLACLVASCGSSHYNSKNNATKATIYAQTNGTFTYNLPCKVTNIHQEKPGKSILLLWLHGGVHDKTLHDLSKFNHLDCCNADDSLLTYLEAKDMKAIVLMPVCHKAALDHSVDWKQCYDDVKAIMDDLIDKQLVDTNRIYLAGSSDGGTGTWDYAQDHGDTFAAALALSCEDPRVTRIPVYFFNTKSEPDCTTQADSVKKLGGNIRYKYCPQYRHGRDDQEITTAFLDEYFSNTKQHQAKL